MHPGGVNIEPDPPAPPDVAAGGPAVLHAVRGRGRDEAGLIELELDGNGDLVDVVVTELAAAQSGSALAAAFAQAYAAARTELGARLTEHAGEAAAGVKQETDASVERLTDVATRAERQLEAILGRLAQVAERGEHRG